MLKLLVIFKSKDLSNKFFRTPAASKNSLALTLIFNDNTKT